MLAIASLLTLKVTLGCVVGLTVPVSNYWGGFQDVSLKSKLILVVAHSSMMGLTDPVSEYRGLPRHVAFLGRVPVHEPL